MPIVEVMHNSEIQAFLDNCYARGLGPKRVLKYECTLGKLQREFQKPLSEATREDIERMVSRIERSPYSDWTKRDYKIAIRIFFRWLRKSDKDYPPEVAWIKAGKSHKQRLPEDCLNEDEIKRLVDAAGNIRDKAFIATLYETGCRIGEMMGLGLRHVEFDPYGAVLRVSGKTGSRRVRMVAFAPLLRNWVENHPLKDDNDAPLWANKTVYFGRGRKPETLTYERLSAIIRFAAAKAGVKKKVNPHSFRHARATHLAKVLPEQQLKAIFGWTQASSMAAIYVHLSGRDTDDAILAMHGMKQTQKTSMLSPQTCDRCKETNSANNNLCQKCAYPLNEKGTGEIASFEQKLAKLEKLSDLLREPEVWNALVAAMGKGRDK